MPLADLVQKRCTYETAYDECGHVTVDDCSKHVLLVLHAIFDYTKPISCSYDIKNVYPSSKWGGYLRCSHG